MRPPRVLTIAGADPSGGAGFPADLKTFSALGAYGTVVVTAVIAQNTTGVADVWQLSADQVRRQLVNLLDDVELDAVKIGMLGSAEVVATVAAVLQERPQPFVVLDPVMVAKSGDRLLDTDAVAAMRDSLLPRVDLVTPNLPEAADLLGTSEAVDHATAAAHAVELGRRTRAVLVKGGHLSGADSTDVLVCGGVTRSFVAPRVDTTNTHGTGCTLSSAIAALRPRRPDLPTAVADAKTYLTGALRAADRLDVGHGHGPVHHFHRWW